MEKQARELIITLVVSFSFWLIGSLLLGGLVALLALLANLFT